MRLSKVVDHFGSIKALANALKLNPTTVQAWKKSGLVPEKWTAAISKLVQQSKFQKVKQEHVSVDSIIAQHGSVKAVAQLLKVTPNTVYRWRDFGRIPSESIEKLFG
ncbi:MAG: hypothetical protein VXX88_06155 [Pseudomonadota bacterium]|nr:hypothetical protein [Pseudomonadota bacterium]